MSGQRDLPIGDRDEVIEPRAGELPSVFVERTAAEMAASAPTSAQAQHDCTFKARGWVCPHEPSFEERLDAIFTKRSEPGENG